VRKEARMEFRIVDTIRLGGREDSNRPITNISIIITTFKIL
jgi:hypothetical protein